MDHSNGANDPLGRVPESRVTTIYEAAAAVFVRDGFGGATSRAISNAAGVAESTLFRLVHDKSSLYSALFEFAWSEINALVAGAGFVADVKEPQKNTDPAEIIIRDLLAIAASYEGQRSRLLITFAFDAISRPRDDFEPANSHSYLRFRARLISYASLYLQLPDIKYEGSPELLADALLARVRGAWMAWYHAPNDLPGLRPTQDELTVQLRNEFVAATQREVTPYQSRRTSSRVAS
jgi:AcrR family transcriptional regulator